MKVVKVLVPQSHPTLCNPMECSPTGSSVHGILHARTLEWVAIAFSNACKWKVKVKSLSCVWLFRPLWTIVCQAPLSMEFSTQKYWSGFHSILQGPFGPRDWTRVSNIAGRSFIIWATRKVHIFALKLFLNFWLCLVACSAWPK